MTTRQQSASRFLRVRNLARYQHYRNRTPPWIKLHQDVLENYEFAALPDASKAHGLLLMLLASRLDNHLPNDAVWLGRKINATAKVDVTALIAARFLEACDCDDCFTEQASDALPARKQSASDALAGCKRIAITEREREGEESRGEAYEARARAGDAEPGDETMLEDFEAFWSVYPRAQNRPDAERAWYETRRERPPLAEVLAVVRRLAAHPSWRERQGKHVPFPGAWLRRKGWLERVPDVSAEHGWGGIHPSASIESPLELLATAKRRAKYQMGELVEPEPGAWAALEARIDAAETAEDADALLAEAHRTAKGRRVG